MSNQSLSHKSVPEIIQELRKKVVTQKQPKAETKRVHSADAVDSAASSLPSVEPPLSRGQTEARPLFLPGESVLAIKNLIEKKFGVLHEKRNSMPGSSLVQITPKTTLEADFLEKSKSLRGTCLAFPQPVLPEILHCAFEDYLGDNISMDRLGALASDEGFQFQLAFALFAFHQHHNELFSLDWESIHLVSLPQGSQLLYAWGDFRWLVPCPYVLTLQPNQQFVPATEGYVLSHLCSFLDIKFENTRYLRFLCNLIKPLPSMKQTEFNLRRVFIVFCSRVKP